MMGFDMAYFVVAIVFVSGVESLLCSRMADRLADNRGTPYNPNKELWGQGWVQVLVVLFNGFPHTGALARTATNIKVGAVSPLAGIFKFALKLLLAVYLLAAREACLRSEAKGEPPPDETIAKVAQAHELDTAQLARWIHFLSDEATRRPDNHFGVWAELLRTPDAEFPGQFARWQDGIRRQRERGNTHSAQGRFIGGMDGSFVNWFEEGNHWKDGWAWQFEWDLSADRLQFLERGVFQRLRGLRDARYQAIGSDAVRRHFERERLGERHDPGLRSGVVRAARRPHTV